MSYRYRYFFSRFARAAFNARHHRPLKQAFQKVPKLNAPFALSFSVFTWLGFDEKQVSPEDELMNTIKHSIMFIQRNEHVKAEQLLHVGLRQAQQLHHEKAITYIYDVMANLAMERDELEKAKKLFISVTQRVMSMDGATENDPRVVHISAKLARISHLQKEYQTAQLGYDWCIDKLNTIIERDPSIDNMKVLAITQDWYGRLFLDHGEYEKALKLMLEALDRMKLVDDIQKEHLVYQLNDIGTVYDHMGKEDESMSYFEEAINLGNSINMEDMGTMYVNLGRVCFKKNLIDLARKNCGRGLKLGIQSKNDDVKREAQMCIKEINSL